MEDHDKVILEGRIYPALKSSINYRYYFVIGLFIIFSYIKTNINTEYIGIVSIISITTLIILNILNFINYWFNSDFQEKIESKYTKNERSWCERNITNLIFFIFYIILCIITIYILVIYINL